MKEDIYTIGEVADLLKISIKDIRYYEYNKLISPSFKGDYDYYLYDNKDLDKMKSIVYMINGGFTYDEIKEELSEN